MIQKFNEYSKSLNTKPFKRVLDFFKKEGNKTPINIKKRPDKYQTAKFNGIVYEVKVGEYKFEFIAYDGSTDTENSLIRTIDEVLYKKDQINPDYK